MIRRVRIALFASFLLLMAPGCARPPEPAVVPMALPITTPATPAPPPPAPPAPIEAHAPDGYVEVHVLQVTQGPAGSIVEIVEPETKKVVTMVIGGTEGPSIALRSEKRAPERPLTHDLVEAMLRELRAEVLQVQVDSLEDGVFHGTVVLVQDDRRIPIDARPSDAIALALGAKAPIYMSRRVIERVGEDRP